MAKCRLELTVRGDRRRVILSRGQDGVDYESIAETLQEWFLEASVQPGDWRTIETRTTKED